MLRSRGDTETKSPRRKLHLALEWRRYFMRLISIVTPCYEEEDNIVELCRRVREVFATLPGYGYEHIFVDNGSADGTVRVLREVAAADKHVKVIVNARNFGALRSGYYGLLQSRGDATVMLVADLQDPPELIKEFIEKWEGGCKIVVAIKVGSRENILMRNLRRLYYQTLSSISEVELIQNFTGFGLYDRSILDILRRIDDPYPYFRGLISEFGFDTAQISYTQPKRLHGSSKTNWLTLFDLGMLGIVKHSRLPIRLATLAGFSMSAVSLLVALGYLLAKLILWDRFEFGLAPVLVGVYFFGSVQIFFIGVMGEYIAAIHTQVRRIPLVIERERINFDLTPGEEVAEMPSLTT